MCGKAHDIVAHHESGIAAVGSMGKKCSDYYAVPLCNTCHNYRHHHGYAQFWQVMDVKRIVIDLLIEHLKWRSDKKEK
jgi:hypothetical protein